MNVRVVFLSSLILSCAHVVPAQHCGGTERWAVKDGTDSAAQQIDFSNITPIQVSDLLLIHQPTIPNNNTTRVTPDETHLYRVSARLVKWKKECCQATDDSDYHLVMTDDTLQFSTRTTAFLLPATVSLRNYLTPAAFPVAMEHSAQRLRFFSTAIH